MHKEPRMIIKIDASKTSWGHFVMRDQIEENRLTKQVTIFIY